MSGLANGAREHTHQVSHELGEKVVHARSIDVCRSTALAHANRCRPAATASPSFGTSAAAPRASTGASGCGAGTSTGAHRSRRGGAGYGAIDWRSSTRGCEWRRSATT